MRITSITVAFNADPMLLARQLVALQDKVDKIIIVDNGSVPSVKSGLSQPEIAATLTGAPHIDFVELNENGGIAAGFNVGIEAARKQGAELVLLMDHDSVPATDMVSKLYAGYLQAVAAGAASNVAAIGPRIVDTRDAQEFPFIRLGWFRNLHIRCGGKQENLVASDLLISSGTLFSIDAFDRIGKFDETLFIDNVDLEWCCRARARGFLLYGVCNAQLDHRLGDRRRVVLGHFILVVHSPLRMYYQTRNRILLYRRDYIPLRWALKDFLRMVARFAATLAFVAPRGQYLRMTILAMRDGILNRGGRLRDRAE